MKLAIVGSRTFTDWETFQSIVDAFVLTSEQEVTTIISGAAKGTDSLAALYAKIDNIPFIEIAAEWSEYGKGAGMIRNSAIVEKADQALVFWDHRSTGTRDTINKFWIARKPVFLYNFVQDEVYAFGYEGRSKYLEYAIADDKYGWSKRASQANSRAD